MLAQVRQQSPARTVMPRTAKNATQRRIVHQSRSRYAGLVRFCAGLGVLLGIFMLYVMLTSRLTSLNYAVGEAQQQQAALRIETARLDDKLAALRSDDRLARIAAQLHMTSARQFAVVTLPATVRRDDQHVAFLSVLTNFLHGR